MESMHALFQLKKYAKVIKEIKRQIEGSFIKSDKILNQLQRLLQMAEEVSQGSEQTEESKSSSKSG